MSPNRTLMHWSLTALCALSATLAACSEEEDGGGSPTVDSNVADEKKVSDLSSDEVQAICDAATEAAASLLTPEATCRLFAVVFSETPADCRQFSAQCSAGGLPGGGGDDEPEPETECLLDDEAKRRDCEATVAELETCMTDSLAAASEALEKVTCDLAGKTAEDLGGDLGNSATGTPNPFGGIQGGAEQPPSCAVVAAKCPELAKELGPSGASDDGGPSSSSGPTDGGPSTPDAGPPASDAGTP